jgi:L-iditol 2-dehydrogenase
VKAAVFEDLERITVKQVPDPDLDAGSIIVKVEACGLCGSDIRNFHSGLRSGIKGQIMGHEIAGAVVNVDKAVSRFSVGDRVAIAPDVSCGVCAYCRRGWVNLCVAHRMIGTHWPGGFAQLILLPAEVLAHGMVHRMPEGLSFDEAALSEPASSVLASQERAGVGRGDTVLIFGDGPIGCLHLEVARSRGAARIIVVGLGRLAQVKAFSPDFLIDAASQEPVVEVMKITGGSGADIAISATPLAETQAQAVDAVRKRGTVVLFGGLPKNNPMTAINANLIHYNEIMVMGSFSYPASMHEKALMVIREGRIDAKKYFTMTVPLEGIVDGIKAAEAGKTLKVLVRGSNEGRE